MTPFEFLTKAVAQARASGHIWPEYAACESALETGWGSSELCRLANNLFGQKQGPQTAGFPTISIQTYEVIGGVGKIVPAVWPKFGSWADSFTARMKLLHALSVLYPDYAAALSATNGEGFITSVSKKWSTDPQRGVKVLQIYKRHIGPNGIVA